MTFKDWLRRKSVESIEKDMNAEQSQAKITDPVTTSGGRGGWFNLAPSQSSSPPMSAEKLLEGYSSMPWLRAAAGRVSEAVSTAQWCLYRPVRNAGNADSEYPRDLSTFPVKTRRKALIQAKAQGQYKEMPPSHPLLQLLERGSDLMPGQQVFKLTSIHVDLCGEGFWLLDRDRTQTPRAIYPLVPTWITRLPTRQRPFYQVQMDTVAKEIPVTEIIRFTDPDPLKPYGRGSGLAKTLGDELQTDEFAAKLTKMRFINSGRPDLIVSADELNPDEVQRLEEGWLEKVGGFMKSFRPFFAARKLDVKVVSQTFAEMQMIELRKFERDSIIQTWGMPPEILGILTNSNRATIQSADFIFSAWVVEPRLEFYRRALQFSLVPLFDQRLMLDFESPIDEDRDFQLVVMKVAPKAFKLDEFRALAGLDPLPDKKGEELYEPGNTALTDQSPGTPPQDGGLPSSSTSQDQQAALPSRQRLRLTN